MDSFYVYTVNRKKGGNTSLIIILENVDGYKMYLHFCKQE